MPRPSLFSKKNKVKKEKSEETPETEVPEVQEVQEKQVDINDYTYGDVDTSKFSVETTDLNAFVYETKKDEEIKEEPKKSKRKKRKNKKVEEVVVEDTVEEKKEEPTALDLLEQLRNEKELTRGVIETQQEEPVEKTRSFVIEEPVVEEKSRSEEKTAYLLSNKNHVFDIDLETETSQTVTLTFYNDKNPELGLFSLVYNKNTNCVTIYDNNGKGKLTKKTIRQLTTQQSKLKFFITLTGRNFKLKINNFTSTDIRRFVPTPINKCDWTATNLTLL